MGLQDISGVFSRYFIVGFFLPSFFALFIFTQAATDAFLPDVYEDAGWNARVFQIGGAAVLIGLVLLGLRYPITRVYEGYPLETSRALAGLRARLVRSQLKAFDKLTRSRSDTRDPRQQAWAARQRDRRFSDDRARVLPTRFGNALRASEDYAYSRWGLDTIAVGPRIEALFSEQERELHTTAQSDLAFFINSALAAFAVGLVLVADEVVHGVVRLAWAWVYAIPFAAGYVAYRLSAGAAERWGTELRASVDLHRLELYRALGLRAPVNFTDERENIARAANRDASSGRSRFLMIWLARHQRPAHVRGTRCRGAMRFRLRRRFGEQRREERGRARRAAGTL